MVAHPERRNPKAEFETLVPQLVGQLLRPGGKTLAVPLEPVSGNGVFEVAAAYPNVIHAVAGQASGNGRGVASQNVLVPLDRQRINPGPSHPAGRNLRPLPRFVVGRGRVGPSRHGPLRVAIEDNHQPFAPHRSTLGQGVSPEIAESAKLDSARRSRPARLHFGIHAVERQKTKQNARLRRRVEQGSNRLGPQHPLRVREPPNQGLLPHRAHAQHQHFFRLRPERESGRTACRVQQLALTELHRLVASVPNVGSDRRHCAVFGERERDRPVDLRRLELVAGHGALAGRQFARCLTIPRDLFGRGGPERPAVHLQAQPCAGDGSDVRCDSSQVVIALV